MSQLSFAVFLFSISSGRITKLLGSGIAILSDSSIVAYPAIEEPSNGIPFSKASCNLLGGITIFFGTPKISINCNLTNNIFSFFAMLIISSFVLFFVVINIPLLNFF